MVANVLIKIQGDPSDVERAYRQVVEAQRSAERGAAGLGRVALRSSKKASRGAREQGASLARLAGRYAKVTAAIAVTTRALTALNDERKKAGELAKQEAAGAQSLIQLSKGDVSKFEKLRAAQRQIFALGGAKTFEGAKDIAFQLGSGELLSQTRFFAQLAQGNLAGDTSQLIGGVSKVQKGFGLSPSTSRGIVSASIGAAADAPNVSSAQIAEQAGATAAQAQAAGIGTSETFGVLSILAQKAPSADEAGTQFRALLTAVERKKLQGAGGVQGINRRIKQRIQELQQKENESAALENREPVTVTPIDVLGRSQAVQAFRQLEGADIAGATKSIEETISQKRSQRLINLAELKTGRVRELERIKNQAILASIDRLGKERIQLEIGKARIERELNLQRVPGRRRIAARFASGTAEFLGFGADVVEGAGTAAASSEVIAPLAPSNARDTARIRKGE